MTADAVSGYTDRVSSYARHRWNYAPEAVEAFVADCGLSPDWVVADIGSGTGMVSAHLLDRVRTVYAVEPNARMREIAFRALGTHPSYREVAGTSHETTLPDDSVDLITVGRAIHWFPPEPTRDEFRRILKPGGWLAVWATPCTDQALLDDLRTVQSEQFGWNPALSRFAPHMLPSSYYFGNAAVHTIARPAVVHETFEMLLGRVSSQLATPSLDHPKRQDYERALRSIFDRHARDGVVTVSIATEIVFGRL
jgi:SAM-dependent methyltransferase